LPWALAAAVVCFATGACGPGPGAAEDTILRFVDAVQAEDLGALRCLLAGAAAGPEADAAAFEAWARSRYEEYSGGRDRGGVTLGDDGIVLVKTFALGKGTYYRVDEVRGVGPDEMRADATVRFGYGQIDLSGWTPGTIFYVAGATPGVIHAVEVPAGHEEITEEVLDTVVVRWSLVRQAAGNGCADRWAVASAVPVEGTAKSVLLTWTF